MMKLTSGRCYAVVLIFDVPPQIVEGQEAASIMPAVSVALGATGMLKVVTGQVSKDNPETTAKRLLGSQLV